MILIKGEDIYAFESWNNVVKVLAGAVFLPPPHDRVDDNLDIFTLKGAFLPAFVCKVYFCTHSLTHTGLFRFEPHLSRQGRSGPAAEKRPRFSAASVHESLFALAFTLLMAQRAAVSRRIVPP